MAAQAGGTGSGVRELQKQMRVVALSLVGFVSCDDDDDDDDGASVVATYSYSYSYEAEGEDDDSYTETFYFYDDATFKFTYDSYTIATGSYTGDATSDGDVTLTIKKIAKGFVEDSEDTSLIDWSDAYGSASVSITISSGTFTIASSYFDGYFNGETFTKQ